MFVLWSLVPHDKIVSLIQFDGLRVEVRVVLAQLLEELYRELLTPAASSQPNLFKVAFVAEVLSDCNCEVEILHSVPPVAWNEDGLTWVLHSFNDYRQAIGALRSLCSLKTWQHFVEVVYCLFLLTGLQQVFTANKLLSDVRAWWHQYPALVTTNARVPGRCSEWVLMHLTT